jgi:uncharacterized protein (DUF983 family)
MKPGAFTIVRDILLQRCPRCRVGKVFRGSIYTGFPKMFESCPVCRLRYAREPGYFLGAMYISYGLALAVMALRAAVLWIITGWSFNKDVIWAVVLFLPFAPSITLLSRVSWIYLDQTIDPERR